MNQSTARSTRPKNSAKSRTRKQKYPAGWDEQKVRKLAEHYDNLADEELAAEIESAPAKGHTMMEVPTALIPKILKLIAQHEKNR